MKQYPKIKYKNHETTRFEAVRVESDEHEKAMAEKHGGLYDSPADFGVETHPNPHEWKPAAKKSPKVGRSEA